MIKFLLGVSFTLLFCSYSDEIRQFMVEVGLRDELVNVLKSW